MLPKHLQTFLVLLVFGSGLLMLPTVQASGEDTTPVDSGQFTNWFAVYYPNENLTGNPVAIQSENTIGGEWGFGKPIVSLPDDHWSARWTQAFNLVPGQYRISIQADDGVRVYLNGGLILDEWHGHLPQVYTIDFTATNQLQTISVEYYDAILQAYLRFQLARVDGSSTVITPPTPTPVSPQLPPVISGQLPRATVTTAALNVRAEPTVNSNILTQIRQGETYTVRRGSINGWFQLIVHGNLGWVNGNYIALNTQNNLVFLAGSANATVTAPRLNVRNRPNIGGAIVTKINRLENHAVVGRNASNTWILLDVNGTFGWVNRDFVTVEAPIGLPIVGDVPPILPPATEYIIATATPFNVNIRQGPGVRFADIGSFPRGAEAKVVGRTADNNWWLIEYNGIRGWVAAAFAQIQANADTSVLPVTG